MKNPCLITSVESRLNLSQTIMKNMVDCAPVIKDGGIPATWENIKHSSIELFTKGSVELTYLKSDFSEVINRPVPFTAHFLFTCTKGRGNDSDVVWSNSLS